MAKKPARLTATIDLRHVPEVIAELRAEMARFLRAAAMDEPPAVAERLREVATAFEVGQFEE